LELAVKGGKVPVGGDAKTGTPILMIGRAQLNAVFEPRMEWGEPTGSGNRTRKKKNEKKIEKGKDYEDDIGWNN